MQHAFFGMPLRGEYNDLLSKTCYVIITVCSYNYSQWSTEGVVLLSQNTTHYICQSTHLTSFAVLVSAKSVQVHVAILVTFFTSTDIVFSL